MERLSMNESLKYTTIKDLVENKINRERAEVLLGLKKRRINQLVSIYNTRGIEGFEHGNVGKSPVNKIPIEVKEKIISLRKEEFYDFNYLHALEFIKDEYDINISYTSLYNIWMSQLDPSKEAHRATKKEVKKKLKSLLKSSPEVEVNDRKEIIKRIDAEFAHARQESAKYFGETVEMDACNERWIDGIKYHVYSAVDNATGTLLATHMEKEKTLRGYLILLYKIITQWGIPANIYTDRRNVFDLKRKKDPLIEKDLHTQFGYICKQLGIFLECSSEPTFKPKVERSFRTTQSQLIPEMRRANIHTLDEANLYIESTYQVKFNNKYSSYTNNTKSVFVGVENIDDLNHILSIKTLRTIDNGHCVRHLNKYYLPMEKNKSVYFRNGTKALVLQCYDGTIAISVGEEMFSAHEIQSNAKFSIEFDVDWERVKRKGGYTPPMTHPYKRASFEKYISKVKHLNQKEKDKMLQYI